MQKFDFCEKLEHIFQADSRFDREAYHFLRDALDFTIKARKKARETDAHVTGQQLLEGVRQYALRQYGPMAPTVFDFWGVHRCEDFGDMVFNFIRAGVFGKSETDSVDDFKGGYSFHEAFIAPYLPEKPALRRQVASDCPAEELR
jgi:uncharacterized repeat protein (TIGR04138 family)